MEPTSLGIKINSFICDREELCRNLPIEAFANVTLKELKNLANES